MIDVRILSNGVVVTKRVSAGAALSDVLGQVMRYDVKNRLFY